MSATLTSGTTTVSPNAVVEYAANHESGHIIHEILGRPDPDVTYRPASTREGTLRLWFATEATANAARTALATTLAPWQLTSAERTTLNMRFVTSGQISLTLLDSGAWRFDIAYREVLS